VKVLSNWESIYEKRLGGSIYERMFGIRPVINATGTSTNLGGSLMPKCASDAWVEASKHFVPLEELLEKACARVAKLCGVPAAHITSGADAALTLMSAACMTGNDRKKMKRLPDTEFMKNEFIRCRGMATHYEQAYRRAGAKWVVVGGSIVIVPTPLQAKEINSNEFRVIGVTLKEIEEAITDKTAALVHTYSWFSVQQGIPSLKEMAELSHNYGIPVIVDAAAQIPPPSRTRKYVDEGADLVAFSGGKCLRGPNDVGLIVGQKDLVEACAMQSSPNSGIGRGFKASKEDIVAAVVAWEWYFDWFSEEITSKRMKKMSFVLKAFKDCANVKPYLVYPDETDCPIPMVYLQLDEKALGITASEVMMKMRNGTPPITLRGGYEQLGIFRINSLFLEDGDEKIIVDRLKEVLIKN